MDLCAFLMTWPRSSFASSLENHQPRPLCTFSHCTPAPSPLPICACAPYYYQWAFLCRLGMVPIMALTRPLLIIPCLPDLLDSTFPPVALEARGRLRR